MTDASAKKRLFTDSITYSVLAHLVGLIAIGRAGIFEFTAPVVMRSSVAVYLIESSAAAHRQVPRKNSVHEPVRFVAPTVDAPLVSGAAGPEITDEEPFLLTRSAPGSEVQTEMAGSMPPPEKTPPQKNSAPSVAPMQGIPMAAATHSARVQLKAPLRKGSEFLAAVRETLTYRIIMFGIPVGEAILDAANTEGTFIITTRVTSNAAISTLYPVDDFVETQLVCGNYLVTRISQHEGNYTRNTGFTLMLRERKTFSVDRLRGRFLTDPLPRGDILDAISGFYFLRNQQIEVGKPLLLHLYDGDGYAPTSVEVLRNERIHVFGLGEVETVVVHPLLTTEGFFRRTGEVFVWLTADAYKVPVRMQTSIPLGDVTAELVSAKVER